MGRIAVAERRSRARDERRERNTALRAHPAERVALPHRRRLEERFGRPLGDIDAYAGPRAAADLGALGAAAASRGGSIFLADTDAPLPVVAHEVAHALQSRSGAPGPAVQPEGSAAEREASRLGMPVLMVELARDEGAGDGRNHPQRSLEPGPCTGPRWFRPSRNSSVAPGAQPSKGVTVLEGIGHDTLALLRLPSRRDDARPVEAHSVGTTGSVERPRTVAEERAPASVSKDPATPAESSGVQLPPAPVADVETLIEAPAMEAETEEAPTADPASLLQAYAAAPPTVKAQRAATLGADVAAVASTEAELWQADVPELHATMQGAEVPEAAVPVLAPPARSVEVLDADAGAPPEPEIPTPQVEGSFEPDVDATSAFATLTDPAPELLAARIDDSLAAVPTRDPSVPDGAGPSPAIPLGGETDPARLTAAEDATRDEVDAARAEATQAVVDGPGPERVRPVGLDETHAVGTLPAPVIEAVPVPEGPGTYLAMGLPPEVQASFDEQQRSAMEQSMAGSVAQADAAMAERDAAKETAVLEAEEGAARLGEEADGQQRAAVVDARTDIQRSRQETVDAQAREVERVESEADERRRTDESAIESRVGEEQARIDDAYAGADRDIRDEVLEGERRAQLEREAAEREAEDRSWWERAVDFVASAINALVDAIGAVFDAVRSVVNGILDAVQALAMAAIDAVAGFVKSVIEAFGELLKAAVTGLLGEIFPELAAALNAAIDQAVAAASAAVDAVAERLKAGVAALVEGLRAGLNAILDTFQAGLTIALSIAQAAITGDWGALARRVLEAVLGIIGVTPEEFSAFVGRSQETFQIIIDDPGGFLGNVLGAVSGGIQLFADHILTHLQAGVIGWLTGALGGAGIVLPERFDLMGVLDLARQILGLTVDMLRRRAARLIGEENVARLEAVLGFVATLVTEGWGALWEQITSALATLRDTVFDGIKSFLIERIVMVGIARLATMFNPVGAIVNLVLTIWNIYTFLRDQLARLVEVVRAVTGAIGDIARGILDAARATVEAVLGRLLPLAIDLLARVIGLGNVGAEVRGIIERVRAAVDRAIDALFQRLARAFRGGGSRGREGRAAEDGVAQNGATAPGLVQRAQDALRTRVDGDDTADDVREKIAFVRRQVPGLSGMELRGPDAQGRYAAWAAASPWQLLGYLAEGPDSTQRPTMLRITLHLTDAADEFAGSAGATPFRPPIRTTLRRTLEIAAEGSTLDPVGGGESSYYRRSGGVVEAPAPEAERLELLTFNTGSAVSVDNSNHAEYQFWTYLRGNRSLSGKVTQIDATMSYSPCKLCSGTLGRVSALTPGAEGHRHLRWVDPWRKKNATTNASLAGTTGWGITPSSVPRRVRGEGSRELSAVHWEAIMEPLHAEHPAPTGGRRRSR